MIKFLKSLGIFLLTAIIIITIICAIWGGKTGHGIIGLCAAILFIAAIAGAFFLLSHRLVIVSVITALLIVWRILSGFLWLNYIVVGFAAVLVFGILFAISYAKKWCALSLTFVGIIFVATTAGLVFMIKSDIDFSVKLLGLVLGCSQIIRVFEFILVEKEHTRIAFCGTFTKNTSVRGSSGRTLVSISPNLAGTGYSGSTTYIPGTCRTITTQNSTFFLPNDRYLTFDSNEGEYHEGTYVILTYSGYDTKRVHVSCNYIDQEKGKAMFESQIPKRIKRKQAKAEEKKKKEKEKYDKEFEKKLIKNRSKEEKLLNKWEKNIKK